MSLLFVFSSVVLPAVVFCHSNNPATFRFASPDLHAQPQLLSDPSGGWRYNTTFSSTATCDFDVIDHTQLTKHDFLQNYRVPQKPVLIRGGALDWPSQSQWTRAYISEKLAGGTHPNTIGDLETQRYDRSPMDLESILNGQSNYTIGLSNHQNYMFGSLDPVTGLLVGTDSFYPLTSVNLPIWFDDWFELPATTTTTTTTELDPIVDVETNAQYEKIEAMDLNLNSSRVYFHVGSSNSGLSAHSHAEAWAGLVWGQKRWFIVPPLQVWDTELTQDYGSFDALLPDRDMEERVAAASQDNGATTNMEERWAFVHNVPTRKKEKKRAPMLECVQRKGDLLYVPNGYLHTVFNSGDCVGISVVKNRYYQQQQV